MTVNELINQLVDTAMEHDCGDCQVIFRSVGSEQNDDWDIGTVRYDIVGGPIKADERMGVILR